MKKLLSLMVLSVVLTACASKDHTYDEFAQCINDSGAVFYGAFWCHNCKNQKEMFGAAAELLPYQECAQGGKDADPALCLNEGVDSYPTWRFSDGTELVGTQDLETLSEATSCALPGASSSLMYEDGQKG